jgi:hypothetical protein
MNRRSFAKTTSAAAGAIVIGSTLGKGVQAPTAESVLHFASEGNSARTNPKDVDQMCF